jgi:epoxyqueuosine reductase
MDSRREDLRRRIGELGFDVVRFAALSPPLASRLVEWIAEGHLADMAWMERTARRRLDPDLVLSGARTAVVLGVNYAPAVRPSGPGLPVWARYALQDDYHDRIEPALARAGRLLEELYGLAAADYRYYVDTGPVLERGWAERAGLGFIGKNAMLISRSHGNWLLLSVILVRAEIAPDTALGGGPRDVPRPSKPVGGLCGACTRCLEACPTAAFPEPGVLDARRCVSYQTIENRGVIPRELRPGIGLRIFGCDVCLEVCPWNRFAKAGRSLILAARPEIGAIPLAELLDLTPESFAERFRRTPMKRLKLPGLLRNACVVAGNSGDPGLLPQLVRLAGRAAPLVRVHAVWAVRRLGGVGLLAEARARETDPAVLAEYEATNP